MCSFLVYGISFIFVSPSEQQILSINLVFFFFWNLYISIDIIYYVLYIHYMSKKYLCYFVHLFLH